MNSNTTESKTNDVRMIHGIDTCPICGCPVEMSVETVVGGSVENNGDTKQARECFEPVDPDAYRDAARVRIYYHTADQLGDERDGRVELDGMVNRDE